LNKPNPKNITNGGGIAVNVSNNYVDQISSSMFGGKTYDQLTNDQ